MTWGDAVGQSCIGMGSERTCHAVGWENGQPLDIRARTTNATGWAFDQAVGITNDGAIVVHGHREGARWDEGRFVLLTPVENEVVAWYKWKTRIHNWYARQYWRTMRAYYRSQ
jgi:hypothetical protein